MRWLAQMLTTQRFLVQALQYGLHVLSVCGSSPVSSQTHAQHCDCGLCSAMNQSMDRIMKSDGIKVRFMVLLLVCFH